MRWIGYENSDKNNVKKITDVLAILYKNIGLKNQKEISAFVSPPPPDTFTYKDLLINKKALDLAIKIIRQAIKSEIPIIVYGDYDADGICATAIMWEALNSVKAKVLPFIPQREREGYGISVEGIDSIILDPKFKIPRPGRNKQNSGLIIVVDSGIVAHEAVSYAHKKGFQVVIIDHHEKPKRLPLADAIIHTTSLCSAGIAYFVSKYLEPRTQSLEPYLELATIATVTDIVPLIEVNRSIVKHGLTLLNQTKRPGLRSLYEVAGIKKVGVYEIGYMIGPRINAAGRIDSALTALRLLCTNNSEKARLWAEELNRVNTERQRLTEDSVIQAIKNQEIIVKSSTGKAEKKPLEKLIFEVHENYHQGIIGLIAGKLTEKYYLPSIVIARGDKESKASARSIAGFNIIEAIRNAEELLINAGGHPMAAGFSIETDKIEKFASKIKKYAMAKIDETMLEKPLKIDCALDLSILDLDFYKQLSQLEPYGLGNREPFFASKATIKSTKIIGKEGKHLKMTFSPENDIRIYDGIFFNHGYLFPTLPLNTQAEIAYTISLDTFGVTPKIQLIIKDLKKSDPFC
jgi:single-stranded-DNA-specific exonuclease